MTSPSTRMKRRWASLRKVEQYLYPLEHKSLLLGLRCVQLSCCTAAICSFRSVIMCSSWPKWATLSNSEVVCAAFLTFTLYIPQPLLLFWLQESVKACANCQIACSAGQMLFPVPPGGHNQCATFTAFSDCTFSSNTGLLWRKQKGSHHRFRVHCVPYVNNSFLHECTAPVLPVSYWQ